MATTDHTDDTILDEELDENEYNLANENDDNEDVLLAESEFDFIDKRTSPSKSQSHPLSPQESKTSSFIEQHALEAEEDILDIGIADEDIENITFQETSKSTAEFICEASAEDTAFEHQPADEESNNRSCRSDAETNSTTAADQYDNEESASSSSCRISHETRSNDDDDDDHSARDDRNASKSNDSNARKKTTPELEDDKNRSSKQHKKISLKKPTSKTYDDLPDLSKVIEKVHPSASGRSRRKVDDASSSGGDRSRTRYKRRPEYEEDRRRNDYRRSYHSRRDRYSDEDYDSDERRSPRRTRSSPYYERDADSGDYDRFETQEDDRSRVPYGGAPPYFAGDEYGHPSQQPMPPSNAAMDGTVASGAPAYQMSGDGDYRVQSSQRVVVPHPQPPHDMMQPRPFAPPRPFAQQPPGGHQPPLGQFHQRPPFPPPAHNMQQPPSFGGPRPPNLLHHQPPPPVRLPPRSQNQFPFMAPRPGVGGPPPRGHPRPPFGPGPPNGAPPPLSASYPPGVGPQGPPPRPLMRPPQPQMHPNMHRGPPPPGGPMCAPRPPPHNNFAPAQQPSPAMNFNRLPMAPPHMRPPQPVPNDFASASSYANAPPNFANAAQHPANAARMARPPPPPQQQNFRPNMPPGVMMGQRPPAWSQAQPHPAPSMQYRHPPPHAQGVERSHDNFPLDSRQMNYANDGDERYYENRDERRIRESDGGQMALKRSNMSPMRSSPTKQSRYDYRSDVNKDEDEEMRLYREKVEQQKKAREQYVRQKEEERLKSQMQNFIQNNIKGILEKREQLMRKQAAVEAGSKSSSSADHDRYESSSSSSRNKTSSRSDHDDYRAAERREERFGYDDKHAGGRREERKEYDDTTTTTTMKRTVYNRDAAAPPRKDGGPAVSTATGNRSQFQYRLGGNAPMERRPESGGPSSKKMTARRSPSAERRAAESKKTVVRGASPTDWRTEPAASKKIVIRRSTQESGAVAPPKRVDEADGAKKEVHKLVKVRYKDGTVAYKSIPVRSSSGNIVTTGGDGPENVSDTDARLAAGTRKRAEQSDATTNSRSRPLARRAVVSSQVPTHSVTNERTDEKTLIESIRKGIRQSSKTLAERFSNLKPSFVSDNEENEYDNRELKKFRRVVSNAN